MSFIEKLKETALEDFNTSVTENGATGYQTTGKKLLDINFAVASLRSESEESIMRKFSAAFLENKVLAMKWLFFARDVREGMGERRLFRSVWENVCKQPEVIKKKFAKVIPLIPEYGRWDDVLELYSIKEVLINDLFPIDNSIKGKAFVESMDCNTEQLDKRIKK